MLSYRQLQRKVRFGRFVISMLIILVVLLTLHIQRISEVRATPNEAPTNVNDLPDWNVDEEIEKARDKFEKELLDEDNAFYVAHAAELDGWDIDIDPDFGLLCRLVEAEAGIEPIEGKIAVANVVLNRVEHKGFPNTIEGVIGEKNQFETVSNGTIDNVPSDETIQAVVEALNGERYVGKDVLFFYNPDLVSRGNWIRSREVVYKIGRHNFAF